MSEIGKGNVKTLLKIANKSQENIRDVVADDHEMKAVIDQLRQQTTEPGATLSVKGLIANSSEKPYTIFDGVRKLEKYRVISVEGGNDNDQLIKFTDFGQRLLEES